MNITIENILTIVCEHLDVSEAKVQSKTRKGEIVQARQLSQYFAKKESISREQDYFNYRYNINDNWSLKYIGQAIGNRAHATVIHSIKTVEGNCQFDKVYKSTVKEIALKIAQFKEKLNPATYEKNKKIIKYINKKIAC